MGWEDGDKKGRPEGVAPFFASRTGRFAFLYLLTYNTVSQIHLWGEI